MSRPGTPSDYSNGTTRAFAGAIVTLVNVEDGTTRVVHRAGYITQSKSKGKSITKGVSFTKVLMALCDEAKAWEGDWKIRCISTPLTVLLDIKGRKPGVTDTAPSYEAQVLSQIDRLDMWEGVYASERDERRRAARERQRA